MGSGEILVIALIALVVLGPEKLPKLAADLGRWVGRARAMARQLRSQLDQEVHLEEMRRLEREAQARMTSPVIPPTQAASPTPAAAAPTASPAVPPEAPVEATVVAAPPASDPPAVAQDTEAPATERSANGQH